MTTSDVSLIIGELLGSFAIGLVFGYILSAWKMAGKSINPK